MHAMGVYVEALLNLADMEAWDAIGTAGGERVVGGLSLRSFQQASRGLLRFLMNQPAPKGCELLLV